MLNYENCENVKFLVVTIMCTKLVISHVKIIIIIIIIIIINFRRCLSYIDDLTTVPYIVDDSMA